MRTPGERSWGASVQTFHSPLGSGRPPTTAVVPLLIAGTAVDRSSSHHQHLPEVDTMTTRPQGHGLAYCGRRWAGFRFCL